LSFKKWVHDVNLIDEVKCTQPSVSKLIGEIGKCFPCHTGNCWKIPKMHILVRMIQNLLRFGSVECFSGQHGERFLKSAVKHIANNTRKQGATYTQELSSHIWEKEIIEYAYQESVVQYLGFDSTQKTPTLNTRCVGKYFTAITNVNQVGQSQYNGKLEKYKRRNINPGIHPHLNWGVENFLSSIGCKSDYNIIG
jgi:hypothetical protein